MAPALGEPAPSAGPRFRPHRFQPRLRAALRGYDRRQLGADLGAGLTVGVVALPLAMAFAIASGVPPQAGLFTAIVAGFLISALGGSNVQIGGPAGAFIVVVYAIVERHGLANLMISTLLAGGLLFLMGWLRLGVLVRYVPVAIVIGFTNGIAVLIALSQLKDALGLRIERMPADFFSQIGLLARHLDGLNPAALGLALVTLAVVVLWPKSYAMPAGRLPAGARLRRIAAHVPGTLVALAGATVAGVMLQLPVETIGSRFGGIPQALPAFALPEFSWTAAKQLLGPTLTIALLGAIESLLCARVADNLADVPRHDPNQELMAQGIANIASPLFGGLPATGTIARTVTNVRAGARTPVAGIVHAATLLAVVLVAAPLAEHVPLPALAGILLFVAWNMGEWRAFARLRRFSLTYRTVLLGTFALTVVFDLTVAVEAGLLLACVFFVYRMGTLFRAEPVDTPQAAVSEGGTAAGAGVQVFALYGALFFGAVAKVEAVAEQRRAGTHTVVLDLGRLMLIDATGLDALEQLQRQLQRAGVRLIVCEVHEQPQRLFARTAFAAQLGPDGLQPTRADALRVAARPAAAAAAPCPAPAAGRADPPLSA
ncbi:SulP family inorganic anion transporter [Piscinibacter sakaiensis]|uniref:SulP family inorganic anion transporter n=1 Tax=Piscinibacter sakaiensis TaxID=1547922 RepID=UPI001E5E09F4|nr:SulP family inorganic anion transporter [Piscinibacter sakaiensis]